MDDRTQPSAVLDRPATERGPEAEDALRQAKQALTDLVAARRAEGRAMTERTRYIVDMYRGGMRPADIARELTAHADELGLSPGERRVVGVSEAAVHWALKVAGVK